MNRLVAVVGGLLILVGCLLVSVHMMPLPPAGLLVLRVLTAVGGGYATAGFIGTIIWNGEDRTRDVRATGAFVVFLIILWTDPAEFLRGLGGG